MKKGIIISIIVGVIILIGISSFFILNSSLFKVSKTPEDILNGTKSSLTGNILQTICEDSINDYPGWAKSGGDIIMWENLDKKFNFRNRPENWTTGVSSPVQEPAILMDMDFIDANEISYIQKEGNAWKIGLFKVDGLNPVTKSTLYEKDESISLIDSSPIDKDKFVIFSISGNNALLRYLEITNSKEETLLNISQENADEKLAVSPKGNYFYFLYGKKLRIFEISSKIQITEINSVESAIWIGDSNVLYSDLEGTFVYNVKTKEKNKLDNLDSVLVTSFTPNSGGVLSYNVGGKGKIMDCQTGTIINSFNRGELKTLTSEITAIYKEGDREGYWRFKNADWDVFLSDKISHYATTWSKY